ncbi:MAG: galactose mutarotase [Verrucomicrobia bacterium]|nr:galactose mutarotase [Verrucomicrobiota bacterium]MDA1065936.1 galactose mutarotase [Verrucomicrobiota bacterium]
MFRILTLLFVFGLVWASQSACMPPGEVSEKVWGSLPSGEEVTLYTLTNSSGMQAQITNYGGIVVSLTTPDRDGVLEDVVLGYSSLDKYVERNPLFGAIVGLYANRIETGLVELDGKHVQLFVREQPGQVPVHMHGGSVGLDQVVWKGESGVEQGTAYLKLDYIHADGMDGYPGPVNVSVTYRLTNDNALKIDYFATTEKTTVINLTNHSYFNLIGGGDGNVLNHEMQLEADTLTEVKPGLIPTGRFVPVAGSPFDFNTPKRIGERIDDENAQLRLGRGYDHNYVIKKTTDRVELFATVYEPTSGRVMEAFTDQPGVQFYTANGMRNIIGKGDVAYQPRSGFCLETQHYPDSPNHPDFPSTVLRAGDVFKSTTVFKFSAR